MYTLKPFTVDIKIQEDCNRSPTCFVPQWCLDRGDQTYRSSGQCSVELPTQAHSQPYLEPQQVSGRRCVTICPNYYVKMSRMNKSCLGDKPRQGERNEYLTGAQDSSENLKLKSNLAFPGMVGLKTISSLTLSNGPTWPSLP